MTSAPFLNLANKTEAHYNIRIDPVRCRMA